MPPATNPYNPGPSIGSERPGPSSPVPPALPQQPAPLPPERQPRWRHAKLGFRIALGTFLLAPLLAVLIVQAIKPDGPVPSVGLRGQDTTNTDNSAADDIPAEPEEASAMAMGMCTSNRAFKNAAPHTAGKNKIIVAMQGILEDNEGKYDYRSLIVSFRDQTVRQSLEVQDTDKVSLVGCIKRAQETPTSQTCEYKSEMLTMYDVKYKLEIYKAQTGERVASRDIPSLPEYPCPYVVTFDPAKKRLYKLYDTTVVEAAIKEAL